MFYSQEALSPTVAQHALPLTELLEIMQVARESDKREAILFRQGRAKFQLPGAGHEAVAALAYALDKQDIVYPYYRDRALMLARGTSLYQLALDYFAKEKSSSGGRQMASHFCDKDQNMVSCATPTGLQCLPAVGTAWGIKLSQTGQIVVCCIGEAATRQGEFYEALCFAFQEHLPIIFVVEDNGYGVSTPTHDLTPYNIGALAKERILQVDGGSPKRVYETACQAIRQARAHNPCVVWIKLARLMSHTSSDDQRIYRSKEELAHLAFFDPIEVLARQLKEQGLISESEWQNKCARIKENVCTIYEMAEKEENPKVEAVTEHIFSNEKLKPAPISLNLKHDGNMAEAINVTLRQLLQENNKILILGEDICDPKGGVFGLTKGLSSAFPERVFNAPLAEATICGLTSGLSLTGHIPVFELQFIDFVGPAFNQIVNQIATLRWRTKGRYSCPMVILAPCGAYIGCGGPWHSQTNEAWFAHAPGLKIAMPSTPRDAAEIIAAAAYGQDPVLVLLPKNLFFKTHLKTEMVSLYPEQARIRRSGKDITILAWGNTVDISLAAASAAEQQSFDVEVIDLCSIVPCDWATIFSSLRKTGRLLVVQEDNRSCSFGQALISESVSKPEIWKSLKAPPELISRADVHVGFHSDLEKAVLPWKEDVLKKIIALMEYE